MPTAEARWFFDGAVPEALERWFSLGGQASTAPPREDYYVLFPSVLGLNVKLREGRLEVKSLVKPLGLRTFATDIAGIVELWEKRIGGDVAVSEFEKLRAGAPHLWIAAGKKRTLRTFSLEGDSILEIAAGTVLLSNGCNVELTRITVDRQAHWSFAFEAFGDPSRVEATLHTVAAHILANTSRPPHPLPAAHSRSYPGWLETCAHKP